MSKKVCFWCENIVEKKGESLCSKCREKKIKSDEELEQISKEYDELFGHLDCKGIIKLFKEKNQEIKELEEEVEKWKSIAERLGYERDRENFLSFIKNRKR